MGRNDDRVILGAAVRQEALITLLDDTGVGGVLWQADADGYLMRGSPLTPLRFFSHTSTEPELIDRGEVFVPAGRVQFIQLMGKE